MSKLTTSSKNVDWSMDERKLMSAYEDISENRLKSADTTITRWLKKHPKSQPALVLRASILQRAGETEEMVVAAIQEVRGTGRLTERSLAWIGMTCKNIGRIDIALTILEEAWTENPDSEEIGDQLFLTSIAANDKMRMISSSKKMYQKTRNKIWARVTAYCEWATKSPAPSTTETFPLQKSFENLKFANLLFETTLDSATTTDHLWLRLQILLACGEEQKAWQTVKFITNGSLNRLWWRMEACKVIAKRLQTPGTSWGWETEFWEWEMSWTEDRQRNYAFYDYYLLVSSHLSQSDPDATQRAIVFLDSLNTQIGTSERSPSLARLKLEQALLKKKDPLALDTKAWTVLIQQYLGRFGDKGSILTELDWITDIDTPAPDPERLTAVQDVLRGRIEAKFLDQKTYLEFAHAHISLIRYKSAIWVPTLKEIEECWEVYMSGRQFTANMHKSDVGPNVTIGLAVVHVLLELWHLDRNDQALLTAVLCAAIVSRDNLASGEVNFLLVRLYRLLGECSDPHLLYTLELRDVQLDTVLHVLVDRGGFEALIGGYTGDMVKVLKERENTLRRSERDLPEYIKDCIRHETYSQIHGIRQLHHSLSYSLSRLIGSIESNRIGLFEPGFVGPAPRVMVEDEPVMDNRDWELLPGLMGRLKLREITALGPEVDKHWAKAWLNLYAALNETGEKEVKGVANDVPSVRCVLFYQSSDIPLSSFIFAYFRKCPDNLSSLLTLSRIFMIRIGTSLRTRLATGRLLGYGVVRWCLHQTRNGID
ncbi:hypothetical protein TREMEDRAFT_35664 [Tremella mesenterica DSM 1558]|uniref:uncharacterized protein n=1 Tax=Tremella mesenterica (strain ATCC 24925 / CBS 8224 / DSM 1558 / NBRC 9311 / NRRL Y-6157 / RJB 2259-6 / UBC 559-6) TaxID=578456 RepID=UPI00032D4126|nr:uncharacterized protein TREMEDRAFT_35664 [Tremella mesenterica DSM 1558]EIW66004.1 hypothetical protein TREMEDRAFT_35664 [Tremella mesenterica DSM 1558]